MFCDCAGALLHEDPKLVACAIIIILYFKKINFWFWLNRFQFAFQIDMTLKVFVSRKKY